MSKQSNIERSEWREKCRRELVQHISLSTPPQSHIQNADNFTDDKLGLNIDPADVRLIPNAVDQYRWGPIPGKEAMFKGSLFERHLSKLSIGPLMELRRGVGKTFQAIKPSDVLLRHSSGHSNALEEKQGLHKEEDDFVQSLKRKLRVYRRKQRTLVRQVERQSALIAKYRAAAEGILLDTSCLV